MPESSAARRSSRPQRLLAAALWTAILIAILFVLHQGKDLFIPFVIGAIMVYLIKTFSAFIRKFSIAGHRLPEFLAIMIAFAAIGGIAYAFFSIVADNAAQVAEEAPRYQQRLIQLEAELAEKFHLEQTDLFGNIVREFNIGAAVTAIATSLAGLLGKTTLVLLAAVFLLLETRVLPRKMKAIFPDPDRRAEVESLLTRINHDMQTYLGVKTFVSVLTGLGSYIVMRAVGLDFAEFWALLIFILNYIPTIGSLVATIFPALLALVQFDSLWQFAVVLLGITAIQQFVGSFLDPALMGQSLNLSPVVVIFSLVLWGWLWGIVGAFLCVPLTVLVLIVLQNFEGTRWVAILLSKTGNLRR